MGETARELIHTFVGVVIGVIIVWIIITAQRKDNNNDNAVTPIDTTYNKVILDSIEYNIITIDSTIVKLKTEYNERIEVVKTLDDSSSIELFVRLVEGE